LQNIRVKGTATDEIEEHTIKSDPTAASGNTGAAHTGIDFTKLYVVRPPDSEPKWNPYYHYLTVGKPYDDGSVRPDFSAALGVAWAYVGTRPDEGMKYRMVLCLRQFDYSVGFSQLPYFSGGEAVGRANPADPVNSPKPTAYNNQRPWSLDWQSRENLYQVGGAADTGHTHPSSVASHTHDVHLPVLPISAELRGGQLYDALSGEVLKNIRVLGVMTIPNLSGTTEDIPLDIPTLSGKTERQTVKLPKVDIPSKVGRIWINGGTYPIELRNNTDVRIPVQVKAAVNITVADIRNAFQMQRYLELNLRAGSRYVEFIKAHFGVTSADSRLQRPEYLGGGKCNFVFSEVLKTTDTGTSYAQGNMAGHGVAATGMPRFTRRFTEHGWLLGLLSVMPRTCYKNRKERRFSRASQLDYFHPVFQGIGDQAVLNKEVCWSGIEAQPDVTDYWDNRIFGYVPRYEEYRRREDRVTSFFKDTYNYWTLYREFANMDALNAGPVLNTSFITCNPSDRIWALTTDRMNGILFDVWNQITAIRPMQKRGIPGRVDHGR